MRVLVVEDDPLLGDGIQAGLAQAGFATDWVRDGAAAELALRTASPDAASYNAVVLDLGLPRLAGLELLRRLRAAGNRTPVVIVTARDAVEDRIKGLDGGADDYVVKPFELAELVSRVGAVLRRRGRLPKAMQVGDVMLDVEAGVAARAGRPLDLTATELRLLAFLVEQRGRIVSAAQILNAVWGYDAYDPNLVQVHVSGLRRKLEAHGPRILHTVRGIGYHLQPQRS